MRRDPNNPLTKRFGLGLASMLVAAAGMSVAVGQNSENWEWSPSEGYHEEEWWDPTDWFDDEPYDDAGYNTYDYEYDDYYDDYDYDYGYNYGYDNAYDPTFGDTYNGYRDDYGYYETDYGWHWDESSDDWDYGWHNDNIGSYDYMGYDSNYGDNYSNYYDRSDRGRMYDGNRRAADRGVPNQYYDRTYGAQYGDRANRYGADDRFRDRRDASDTRSSDQAFDSRMRDRSYDDRARRSRHYDRRMTSWYDYRGGEQQRGVPTRYYDRTGDARHGDRYADSRYGDRSQRTQRGEMTGRIVGLERLRGTAGQPDSVRLRLETDDGRTRTLHVGDVDYFGRTMPQFRQGQDIVVGGEMINVDGRRVFKARELRAGSNRYEIPSYAYQRRIQGELESLRKVNVRGSDVQAVVANVRTPDGDRMSVLIGNAEDLKNAQQTLKPGTRVRVDGYRRDVDGSSAFIVQDVKVQPNRSQRDRSEDRSQNRSQERDRQSQGQDQMTQRNR